MVATAITAVSGDHHSRPYRRLAAIHLFGLLIGAAVLMFVACAVGVAIESAALGTVFASLTALVAVPWAVAQLLGRPFPTPSPSAQVPRAWSHIFTPSTAMLAYGVGLGAGVFTRVLTPSLYVCVAFSVVYASPALSLASAAAYAVARVAPLLVGQPNAWDVGRPLGTTFVIFRGVDACFLLLGLGVLVATRPL
jgi:hypothetical protein